MAEAAGLVLGAVGLVGLFSTCVQAFDMVQIGRTQDRTLKVLATKLDNQKARFIIWGESLDLDKETGLDPRLEHPVLQRQIRRSCELMYELFADSFQLQQRYGLREEGRSLNTAMAQSPDFEQSVWKHTFGRLRARLSQPRESVPAEAQVRRHTIRWIIRDQKCFQELVNDLRELIDDLKSLTDFRGVHERQREITTFEIESISDRESISLLQEAAGDDDRLLSDVASVRALSILVEDQLSMVDTYHTAPEIQDEEPGGGGSADYDLSQQRISSAVPQNQRVVQRHEDVIPRHGTSPPELGSQVAGVVRGRALFLQRHGINLSIDLDVCLAPTLTNRFRRLHKEIRSVLADTSTSISVTCAPLPNTGGQQIVGSILGPPESAYENGVFHVFLLVANDYPFKAPIARCMTKVYHPNIEAHGRICVDILASSWSPVLTIGSLLYTIQQLLGSPEPNDPFVPEIASTMVNDPQLYDRNARTYTQRYANQVSPTDDQVQQALHSTKEAARRRGDGEWTY